MKRTREYSTATMYATKTLGALIATGRRRNGWTITELAQRVGADPSTIARIERGIPTVAIGVVFDTAVLCGVDLFDTSPHDLPARERAARAELALLPGRVRGIEEEVSDDF